MVCGDSPEELSCRNRRLRFYGAKRCSMRILTSTLHQMTPRLGDTWITQHSLRYSRTNHDLFHQQRDIPRSEVCNRLVILPRARWVVVAPNSSRAADVGRRSVSGSELRAATSGCPSSSRSAAGYPSLNPYGVTAPSDEPGSSSHAMMHATSEVFSSLDSGAN
jgi:hypothetical protein